MRIALYQPDIAGNVGTILRLAACWQVPVDIILPCGFPASDAQLRRAAMDYGQIADVRRHAGWADFRAESEGKGRLLLLTTRAVRPFHDFAFEPSDILLLGRESAGAPDEVHAAADARLVIPMAGGARSLNVVTAATLALGEALRQIKGFPAVPALSTSP